MNRLLTHWTALLFITMAVLWTSPIRGDETTPHFGIAMLQDGPMDQGTPFNPYFRPELLALTEGEFELDFKVFEGDRTVEGARQALRRAYADPEVDLVLVTGLVANQVVAAEREFVKPTFLPSVFDADLVELPRAGESSGSPNLNYLVDEISFSDNLDHFLTIVPFRRLGILVDGSILTASTAVVKQAGEVAAARQVEIVAIPYADPDSDLAALIPEGIDAVMVGGLARSSDDTIERLVGGLMQRQLPSYSFAGDRLVHRGLLTTDVTEADGQRLARRMALNMHAVMLGEEAAEQPVDFRSKRRLYLNLQTARSLDVWPPYDVLVEAVLVGDDPGAGGLGWDLAQVAEEAVRINLDLLTQQLATDAGGFDVRKARGAFWPQLSADLSVTQLDGGSAAVRSGAAAQRSTGAAVTVNQSLYSEPLRANLAIQQQVQLSREAELERFRLDTVLAATTAFLDILRTDTQVRVQRDNLERTRANLDLARDRVRVGSASLADAYRWQRELATARQNSIDAYTQRTVAREALNRILHRPFSEPFQVVVPTLDDPYLLMSERGLRDTINNPKAFRRLSEFHVVRGLQQSPEVAALKASIAAKVRERISLRREVYTPSVSLQGQLSTILEEDRVGTSLQGESDASLGVVASWSLFQGGQRSADIEQSEVEIRQLEVQLQALEEVIEQGIRANLHLANASYNNIALAQQAADAAGKNLDLITDSYSEGVVSILELLDAQSAALQSDEAASNAVFDFLVDLMNVQRSAGQFDFSLSDTERQGTLLELQRALVATEEPSTEPSTEPTASEPNR